MRKHSASVLFWGVQWEFVNGFSLTNAALWQIGVCEAFGAIISIERRAPVIPTNQHEFFLLPFSHN